MVELHFAFAQLGYKRVKRHEDFYSDGAAAFEYAKVL